MIVEKGHKKSRRIAVRAQDLLLDLLAVLVHLGQRQRTGESLHHRRQHESEGEIECRVDADQLAAIASVPADEPRDGLLAVEDLAEREEVLLARLERRFAHGVTE